MQGFLSAAIVFVVAFLLGSIPWGLIISKVFFHTDIREHGSGNIGTTNAMRTMGKAGGVAVFVLDFAKGVISGIFALFVLFNFVPGAGQELNSVPTYNFVLCCAFLGCVWGHIFSPWLHFRGGKGIAVAIGCLFIVFGVKAFFELAVFIVVVLVTRYISAGSLAAAVACPFLAGYQFLYSTFDPGAWVLCFIAALTVIWAHRENIARLRAGNERRIGSKGEA